jgi:hypothetical protein
LLITVGILLAVGKMPAGNTTQVFATGVANMIKNAGMANAYDVATPSSSCRSRPSA